jgi:Na+-driven multidrug efflux pump
MQENLLKNESEKNKPKPKSSFGDSVLVKTASFGWHGTMFSAHVALNGKYLASLDVNGASAASLASTFQSVVIGSSVGFLLSIGLNLGGPIGKGEYKIAGDIAKTGAALALITGGLSSGAMLLSRVLFPLFVKEEAAKIASDFFTGYSLAPIPLLMLVVGPQIAFQNGDWFIPPICMTLIFTVSGAASYFLGFEKNLGAIGVGLGGSISSLLVASGLGLWMRRNNYKKYDLYVCHIEEFSKKMKDLLKVGWKLAFQRLTEWGNLFIIAVIFGLKNDGSLAALNAGLSYLIVFGTGVQGCAQAAGMIVTKNKGTTEEAIKTKNKIEAYRCHKKNIQTFIRSNLFGLCLTGGLAGVFYLEREPLTHFFLSSDASEEVKQQAENLLWISMLGLVADSFRIISAGVLRGWKDLLYPSIVSSIMMTLMGISIGLGLEKEFSNDAELMFYVRDISIVMSSLFIMKRCHSKIKSDEKVLEEVSFEEGDEVENSVLRIGHN